MNQYTENRIRTSVAERLLAEIPSRGTGTAAQDIVKQALAEETERRVQTGEVMILTDDEQRMLAAYRRRVATTAPPHTFKWRIPHPKPGDTPTIVPAASTVLILDPQEEP